MAIDLRKAETRHKIQLGGMVVKSGLGSVDAMALLGLLVENLEIMKDPGEQQRLRESGRRFVAQCNTADASDA
jgi:Conjugal transfer protein TraD